MLATINAPACTGMTGELVEAECDISNGLPGFTLVGLGDKAVEEAKERIRSAIKNSGLQMPQKRITLNLAPANLRKDGSSYDLGMAISILKASQQINKPLESSLFIGELSLDGSLRPTRGLLSCLQLAIKHQFEHVFIPAQNAEEARLVSGLNVYAAKSLSDIYRHLVGEQPLSVITPTTQISPESIATTDQDFSLIYGQEQAKRALEIAAAGSHNLLLSGPPGSGKTLLAKALPSILPPLSLPEVVEVTQLYSLAGLNNGKLITKRPFRNPHHTASTTALVGGGRPPHPGEISLSNLGVLFLDELPEFPRSVLESLRQPLEDNIVTIARAQSSVCYPAKFILIATQNPCPCGYFGDPSIECSCSPGHITQYNRKISGPLLDRIDLILNLSRVTPDALTQARTGETSKEIQKRVQNARHHQLNRFESPTLTNAHMSNREIRQFCRLDSSGAQLARKALDELNLSARVYMRILKVARTIADLDNDPNIRVQHLTEALQYRPKL